MLCKISQLIVEYYHLIVIVDIVTTSMACSFDLHTWQIFHPTMDVVDTHSIGDWIIIIGIYISTSCQYDLLLELDAARPPDL